MYHFVINAFHLIKCFIFVTNLSAKARFQKLLKRYTRNLIPRVGPPVKLIVDELLILSNGITRCPNRSYYFLCCILYSLFYSWVITAAHCFIHARTAEGIPIFFDPLESVQLIAGRKKRYTPNAGEQIRRIKHFQYRDEYGISVMRFLSSPNNYFRQLPRIGTPFFHQRGAFLCHVRV